MAGWTARWALLIGLGTVAIQPSRSVPSHSQIGCRIRVRGRPSASTVAAEAHTIPWAIRMNAGAICDSCDNGVTTANLATGAGTYVRLCARIRRDLAHKLTFG